MTEFKALLDDLHRHPNVATFVNSTAFMRMERLFVSQDKHLVLSVVMHRTSAGLFGVGRREKSIQICIGACSELEHVRLRIMTTVISS